MTPDQKGELMNLLKRHRLAKGLTCAALGHRIGLTPGAVSRWETGRGIPGAKTIPKLAKVLGIDAMALTRLISPEAALIGPAAAGAGVP